MVVAKKSEIKWAVKKIHVSDGKTYFHTKKARETQSGTQTFEVNLKPHPRKHLHQHHHEEMARPLVFYSLPHLH
jgi:hypothetical protein